MRLKSRIFVVFGLAAVGLGTAGIFLPLLPTTPFLLLAAFLFAKSSRRLHMWLLAHRHLGPYIHAFRSGAGLTRAQKLRIVCSFTLLMAISVYFLPNIYGQATLAAMWVFWVVVLTLLMKTAPSATSTSEH